MHLNSLRNRFIQSSNWNDGFTDVSRTFVDVFKPSTKMNSTVSYDEDFESKETKIFCSFLL